jgi:type I restriction enzyme S subunit
MNLDGLTTSTLAEVCSLVTDGTHDTPKRVVLGFPLIKAKEIVGGRIDFDTCDQISEEEHRKVIARSKPEFGDTLFAHIGASLGEAAFVNTSREFSIKNIALFKPNRNVIEPRYLYYLVISPAFQGIAKGTKTGAAQPFLGLSQLRAHPIEYHRNLSTQRRIAGILSTYDELIENSQQRVRLLEAMARAVYREWFVHFRFPGYEKYLRVASPLGNIPQGWEVKKLGDIISYNRHVTKPGPHLVERKYVPIDCLPSKSLGLLEAKPIEGAQSSLQLFEKGDILFGAMRPYFHKVVVAPFAGVTRTTCFVFKPKQPEWHAFATMTAFEEGTIGYANSHSQGATIPYAVWDGSLSAMPLVLPPKILLQRFEKIVAPMLSRISESFFAVNNLRRTRDLLLPKLMSGEINLSRAKAPEAIAV